MMDVSGESASESTVRRVASRQSSDPLCRVVRIMLAIYLSPVLVLVLLVGVVVVALSGIARAMNRLVSGSA